MILKLPVPPSVNDLTRNVSHKERIISKGKARGRRRTREYEAWIKKADAYYMTQKKIVRPVRGKLEIKIRLPMKMRGDVSNRIKAAEDYLVSREITGDDKHNWKISAERADVTECEIEILGGDAA
jgi:Holliday junction resolvase RusA-like endonuclease